jgi:phage FluMu protein gp41
MSARQRYRPSPLVIAAKHPEALVGDDALPLFLTRRDVAAVATARGVPLSPRTIERLALPYTRISGGPALYERDAVLAFIAERRAAALRYAGGNRPNLPAAVGTDAGA